MDELVASSSSADLPCPVVLRPPPLATSTTSHPSSSVPPLFGQSSPPSPLRERRSPHSLLDDEAGYGSPSHTPEPSGRASPRPSRPPDQWACLACTFLNRPLRLPKWFYCACKKCQNLGVTDAKYATLAEAPPRPVCCCSKFLVILACRGIEFPPVMNST